LRIPIEDNCLTTIDSNNHLPPAFHVRVVPCRIARLDDVVSEPVGFIKIDVEGHEETVFRSSDRYFASHPPDVIIFESAGSRPLVERPVARFLAERGYDLFSFADSFLGPKIVPAVCGETVATIDHLAIRADAKTEVLSKLDGACKQP